jgi:hypothetical protein
MIPIVIVGASAPCSRFRPPLGFHRPAGEPIHEVAVEELSLGAGQYQTSIQEFWNAKVLIDLALLKLDL